MAKQSILRLPGDNSYHIDARTDHATHWQTRKAVVPSFTVFSKDLCTFNVHGNISHFKFICSKGV